MMSMTPDQFRKVGTGLSAPSPAPFLTPRPERRRPDFRSTDWNNSSNRLDKDKEVNVQVILRCRPLFDDELRMNVVKAVSCNESKREVSVLQNVANKQVDRVFTFDKVFGPKAQQRSIYDQAISPIVNDVLEGFNCTVFAYGQTGTGKTYTMEGGMRNKGGDLPAEAGVIPRAVRQIFDSLEAQNADYNIKVTFLELYNEEITDLLATEDFSKSLEERQKRPISLMEDGKGCVVVRGLEEEAVYSANEIYNLLERGAARRRTADTLLNKRSSRSHSVCSITIHVKESSIGDEELIKCGKLNLVDLAGSENISRSGAREGRAREAGEINKSLLTLGRVINALVEHSVHVPYRDSKLTRILRDSLGGKTKTCIIATISPSAHCLEETLSTLDYAYRAKNIKNKPEANQKISKAVLLRDLYLEMERMKQDVRAAREKNGVYIPHERFLQDEAEKKARDEKIEQLEIDLNISEKQVNKFRELYLTEQEDKLNIQSELKDCQLNLERRDKALQDLKEKYNIATSKLKEKEFIISRLQHSESCLTQCAKELRVNLVHASEDIAALFAKLEKKDRLEAENQTLLLTFGSRLDQSLKDLHKTILGSVAEQQEQLRCMEEHVCSFLASKCDATQAMESKIKRMTETYASATEALRKLAEALQMKASSDMEQMKSMILSQATEVKNFLGAASLEAKDIISDIQRSLNEQRQLLALSVQQREEGLLRSLVSAQDISRATLSFFTDIHRHASELMKVLEESKIDKFHQFQNFERSFKEEALHDEELAMEKIAAILAGLRAKRTVMVSEASRKFEDSCLQENKKLLQVLSNVQLISVNAEKELDRYVEKAKSNYTEDTFTSAESRATMEDFLLECANKMDCIDQHQGNAQLGLINQMNNGLADIESVAEERINGNRAVHEKLVSTSSSVDAEFEVQHQDMLVFVKDSLMLDHENEEQIQSLSNICLDQLKTLRENHSVHISDIRNRVEQGIRKEYLVDDNSDLVPEKRKLEIPSITFIEEMRTPVFELTAASENKPNLDSAGNKIQQQLSPNRTPFGYVN
ncbi:hypothetical protein ACH5RR_005373 [Cinchona calisaya]|uniref:Kinesin motor domain-containing protein n=1 Tax=Cinchona calisaya TaxID=153742 RepID=A0ABD3AL13_9GENT